jgi:hypothetical protein
MSASLREGPDVFPQLRVGRHGRRIRSGSVQPSGKRYFTRVCATNSWSVLRSTAPGTRSLPTMNAGVPLMPRVLARRRLRSMVGCHSGLLKSRSSRVTSSPVSLRNAEELLFGEIVFRRQQGLMKCPVFALQV